MNEANTLADVTGQDETIDEAHERLGHTAPRVSPADMQANIEAEYFVTGDEAMQAFPLHPSLKLLTICVLILRNGFVVIGHSAPASQENFNAELGRKFAHENALRQVWPLMGYALREKLAALPDPDAR